MPAPSTSGGALAAGWGVWGLGCACLPGGPCWGGWRSVGPDGSGDCLHLWTDFGTLHRWGVLVWGLGDWPLRPSGSCGCRVVHLVRRPDAGRDYLPRWHGRADSLRSLAAPFLAALGGRLTGGVHRARRSTGWPAGSRLVRWVRAWSDRRGVPGVLARRFSVVWSPVLRRVRMGTVRPSWSGGLGLGYGCTPSVVCRTSILMERPPVPPPPNRPLRDRHPPPCEPGPQPGPAG